MKVRSTLKMTDFSYYFNIQDNNGANYILLVEVQTSSLSIIVTNIMEMFSSEKHIEDVAKLTECLGQDQYCQWKLDAPCRILELVLNNGTDAPANMEFHLSPVSVDIKHSKILTMFAELVQVHTSHKRAVAKQTTSTPLSITSSPRCAFPIKRLGVKRKFQRSSSSDLIHPSQSRSAGPARGVQYSSTDSD